MTKEQALYYLRHSGMSEGQIDAAIEALQKPKHICQTCKYYFPGECDGSCGSYICKNYNRKKDNNEHDN